MKVGRRHALQISFQALGLKGLRLIGLKGAGGHILQSRLQQKSVCVG